MDQILAQLQKVLGRVMENIGPNNPVVLGISEKLGQVQSLLDSADDEQTISTVQEKWREIQSKVTGLQLDDNTIANALKSAGKLHDQAGSTIQSFLSSMKLDETWIADMLQKAKRS